jgi:hypothetical protein
LTNVNILLSSGREFILLFLVYMTYAYSVQRWARDFEMAGEACMWTWLIYYMHGRLCSYKYTFREIKEYNIGDETVNLWQLCNFPL